MNESGKHTKGTWKYLDLGEVVLAENFEVVIATVESEADGNLIAAAPDLLAALKEARGVLVAWMIGSLSKEEIANHSTIITIDSALTKAGSPT